MRPIWGLVIFGLLLSLLAGQPAAAQEAAQLGRIFDAYNAAAKAGDVDKMLSLRSASSQKEVRAEIAKDQKNRQLFVVFGRASAPESYQIQHVSPGKGGAKATLYVLGQFAAMPEARRPRPMRLEVMVAFKKENGAWKLDLITPLADLDKIKRPKDLAYDPKDADRQRQGEIAGRIVKTEFKPGYTLVMVRVMDEENAVFLPAKEALLKEQMPLHDLDPWKLFRFTGHPHKTDKLKFFATGGRPVAED